MDVYRQNKHRLPTTLRQWPHITLKISPWTLVLVRELRAVFRGTGAMHKEFLYWICASRQRSILHKFTL